MILNSTAREVLRNYRLETARQLAIRESELREALEEVQRFQSWVLSLKHEIKELDEALAEGGDAA